MVINKSKTAWKNLGLSPKFTAKVKEQLKGTPAPPKPIIIPSRKLQLKNVKLYPERSEETTNFTAQVWYRCTHVADVDNNGQGGCHRVHVVQREMYDAMEEWINELPWMSYHNSAWTTAADPTITYDRFSCVLDTTLENLVDILLDKHERDEILMATHPGANRYVMFDGGLVLKDVGKAVKTAEYRETPITYVEPQVKYYPCPHKFRRMTTDVRHIPTGNIGTVTEVTDKIVSITTEDDQEFRDTVDNFEQQ